ncbi:hypothetical protein LINPERPRIM_LOCUS5983 [Linum perenne]
MHILDMPMHLRSTSIISRLVSLHFTSLLAIDPTGCEQSKWRREVKVLAEVTVADPLNTGITLDLPEGRDQKVKFKYERIQDLCIFYGRLGHILDFCDWRKAAMANGESRTTSGEYRLSLKVGVPSDSSEEELSDDDSSVGLPFITAP